MKKSVFFVFVLIFIGSLFCMAETAYELFEQANNFVQAGDIDTALLYYKKAHQKEPDNTAIYVGLLKIEALVFYNKKQYQEAIKNYYEASQIEEPTDVDKENVSVIYFSWAAELYEKGKLAEAMENIERSIALNPNDPIIYNLAGRIAYFLSQFDKAITFWENSLILSENQKAIEQQLDRTKKEAAVERGFLKRYFNPFTIYFPGQKDPGYISKVLFYLDQAKDSISYDTRLDLVKNTPVIIYIGDQFKQATESTGRAQGLYDGKIRISEQDVSKGDKTLKNVIFHEYGHAVLVSSSSVNIPIWFNEGFAQYCEPDKKVDDKKTAFVREVLKTNKDINMDKVNSFFDTKDNDYVIKFSYDISYLFFMFLIDKYGKHRVILFLNNLKRSKDFEKTFYETFLIKTSAAEKQFFDQLMR
ncbi:MAG: peptidase MA family metallohydrolase [Candidatus Omnitrophica bacterium]|nr:peptidase MA family metallohydrolase [Candidatus Omnitrophota bacterium]